MFISLHWKYILPQSHLEKPTLEVPKTTLAPTKSLVKRGQLVAHWVKDEKSGQLYCKWINQ